MNTERNHIFYMANLGSEFARVLFFKKNNDKKNMNESILRSEKIISQIRSFEEMKDREFEVGSLDYIINFFKNKNEKLEITDKSLTDYFYPFIIRLMQNK